MQIKDSIVAPLLIFRKDNLDEKLDEFALKHSLNKKKRDKLFKTVWVKMRALENFVPDSKELSTAEIGPLAGSPGKINF